MFNLIVSVILISHISVHMIKSLSYELSPSFINTGEGFLQVCTFTSSPALSRGTTVEVCMLACEVVGCNLEERANITCSTTWIQVNVRTAEEDDFGVWRCSGDGTSIERYLSEYVPVTLTYTQYEDDVIEGQEYTFTCQAASGVPGSVIKWEVNGIPTDDGLQPQVIDTGTQTSSFVLTAHRSDNTIQCMAEQVHNKDPVWADVIYLDVSYPPLKATPVQDEVVSAINKTTTLECIVETDDTGNPDTYIFAWSREGDVSFTATNNGTLIFVPSSEDYYDVYSCVPENIAGTGIPGEIYLILKGL